MSNDTAVRDVLPLLRVWLARCQRHDQHPLTNAQTGDVLLRVINELGQLRRTVERLQAEQQKLEQVVTGRPRGLTR
jgi:hypothetical protein